MLKGVNLTKNLSFYNYTSYLHYNQCKIHFLFSVEKIHNESLYIQTQIKINVFF